jgi:hypothetical protein
VRQLLDTPPAGFSFRHTVLSHGWCLLAPFRLGPRADFLEVTLVLPGGGALEVRLEAARGGGA